MKRLNSFFRYWMTEDSTVRCSQEDNNSAYAFVTLWAIAMSICLGLSIPAFTLRTLWPWRYPLDRLYIWDKHGRPIPNDDADKNLGGAMFAMYNHK